MRSFATGRLAAALAVRVARNITDGALRSLADIACLGKGMDKCEICHWMLQEGHSTVAVLASDNDIPKSAKPKKCGSSSTTK
jgi:hypothetical protein